VVLTRCG